MKRTITTLALVGGALLLMSASKANKEEEKAKLRNAIIDKIKATNDSEISKETFIGKVYKMNQNEIITLYKFMLTHNGNYSFLSTQLRSDVLELNRKYDLFG